MKWRRTKAGEWEASGYHDYSITRELREWIVYREGERIGVDPTLYCAKHTAEEDERRAITDPAILDLEAELNKIGNDMWEAYARLPDEIPADSKVWTHLESICIWGRRFTKFLQDAEKRKDKHYD